MILFRISAAIAALAAQVGSLHAENLSMDVGGWAAQPRGHVQFCRQSPTECVKAKIPADPEKLDEAGWIAVRRVNRRINSEIIAKSDLKLYGKEEWWTVPAGEGDCEDYALLKRRILIEENHLSPSNVLLTVAQKEDGEGHAVLTLRTTDGDFVLDNLHPAVRLWTEVKEYKFVKRQSSDDAGRWAAIGDPATAPSVSAGNKG